MSDLLFPSPPDAHTSGFLFTRRGHDPHPASLIAELGQRLPAFAGIANNNDCQNNPFKNPGEGRTGRFTFYLLSVSSEYGP
jgi:hypothetical protein